MTTAQRPMGWHRDPGNERLQRWWDGTAWTPLVRPIPRPQVTAPETAAPDQAPQRTPMSTDATRALVITAIAAVLFTMWGYTTVIDANPTPPASVTEQAPAP